MSKRILIVEDAGEFRLLLREVIEALGYEPVVAERATEAWRLMQRKPVSLILLDLKMPQIMGHNFIKFIRERGVNTPVIVVSGYLQPKVLESLLQHGIRTVISKPFKMQRLTREISNVLAPE